MILALFFTRGVSLQIWQESGLFEREKALYEGHILNGNFKKIYWFTYGSNDSIVAKNLIQEGRLHHSIKVCSMPYFFNIPKVGFLLYSILLPFIQHKALRKSHILKTNQIDGSWSAIFAKFLYRKKLVVRSGFTLSIFIKNSNKSLIKIWIAKCIESFAYNFCDLAFVSSSYDKDYVVNNFNIESKKIRVVPNFVDIEIFKPLSLEKFKNRMIFIGRLNKQKNLFNLIDAASMAKINLDIYGYGELRESLELHARSKSIKINFMGTVSNDELPQILSQYQYYVLPSLYEGLPKTLIEAMACGLLCIGTNVQGINELIQHEKNGFLADDTDTSSIYKAIDCAIKIDKIKSNLLCQSAINSIRNKYSLQKIVSIEKELFDA